MPPAMLETVKRRLHISGLTPSLTASELCSRFSAFGTVINVTGFGLLDGNGNPRKFAYLTLETTEDKLKRCISGLSGTVWKGAKLRIGDARPDYKER
jgi:RNA recognition motif-containing protein